MAVTSWTTDEDDTEPLDWDNLQNKYVYSYIEAVARAIRERVNVIPWVLKTVQGLEVKSISLLAGVQITGIAMTYDRYAGLIDDLIDGLIGHFVDYTVNNGSYDNLSEIPYWTEFNLLVDIGDSERIRASVGSKYSSVWIRQVYDILNRLVWTNIGHGNLRVARKTIDVNDSPSLSELQTIWNGTVWNDLPIFSGHEFENYSILLAGGTAGQVTRVPSLNSYIQRSFTTSFGGVHRWKINRSAIKLIFNPFFGVGLESGLQAYHDIDVYFKPYRVHHTFFPTTPNPYQVLNGYSDQGTGWVEDLYRLDRQFFNTNESTDEFWIGRIDSMPSESIPGTADSIFAPGKGFFVDVINDSIRGVFKYDIPDGFVFYRDPEESS